MKQKRTSLIRNRLYLILAGILLGLNVYAQQRTVTGTVVDEQGEGMPGVNVVIKGTTTGVVTDLDGKFSLNVPDAGSVLSVSFVGYDPQEITVGTQSVFTVTLAEASTELDEVVVVGYGVVRKRDLTGSVVSIKQKDIVALPTSNALESLQGKVAGMDLTKQSGEAGAGLSFTVRGNRSLNASNQPLILVDGIPYGGDLDINPNIIESIEVLKDASSTAIYGSRGANGVILVTTKKGTAGKVRLSYNGYYGNNSIVAYPEIQDIDQWADFKREAYRTTGAWTGPQDDAKIFGAGYDYVKNHQNVDWLDLLVRDGSQTAHSLSLSSGNETTTFSISLEYLNERGLIRMDNFERLNGHLALEHKILDNLSLNASVLYTNIDRDKRRDPMNRAIYYNPYGDVYLEDGSINPLPFNDGQTISPLAEEIPGAYKNNFKTNRFVGAFSLNWEIIKGLMAKTSFGIDQKNVRQGHYADKYTLDGEGSYSRADATNTRNSNWVWENTVTYDKSFKKHNFQLLAGNALYKNIEESYYSGGKDLISPTMEFYNLGATQREKEIKSDYIQTTMASFFGRLNYKFNERYLLTASIRYDGSSILAEGKKWGVFPSAAIAWRMNEESFLKQVDYLSNLKLRLSYGTSGTSAVSPYQTEGGLGQTMYAYDVNGAETPGYGYYPRIIPNKDLTWESTATTDIGVDFGFLNNRISGSLDFYLQNTKNLLMLKQIPPTNGYPTAWDNVGKTRNKGFELVLNTLNINHKKFTWNTDFTFTLNREEIVELADGSERDISNGWFVGEPTQVHYAMEKVGIWQLGEETEAAKYKQKPGQIRIKDQNEDDAIDNDNDRVILGTPRPDFIIGFNNTLSYRNFDLRVFMYWRQGQMIRSEAHGSGYRIQGDRSPVADYWTPENPTNEFPRPDKSMATNDVTLNSLGFVNGSFFKIREMTLGYRLPASVLSPLRISNLRVYCTLKNFFTFSHIGKYDPERGGSLSFPMTKQAIIGINLDF